MLPVLLSLAMVPQVANPPQGEADKRVYFVGTAHLDTNWLWTVQDTIREYIPNTLHRNFDLFEKYPDYVFSFEGAIRYMMAKEYYPEDYARMKEYIAKGRWRVTGSWVDAVDTNIPSPESLIRQTLYGNGFYKKEFGKTSNDVFLPDCFGFGYALPSIEVHSGLRGFSTQKLTWGSAAGIPFTVGTWEGVDGSSVVAALDAGGYGGDVPGDAASSKWLMDRLTKVGEQSGAYVDYRYHGTGDKGGSPKDRSVANLEKAIQAGGPIKALSAGADQLYRDLTPSQVAKLPHYKGELLMTTHGTGCYTSQVAMKRWNRKNEVLADAAERAAVTAELVGGNPYPQQRLTDSWNRFLWHQFHDDLTGTSIPEVYVNSWNDELVSYNEFSSVLNDSVRSVAARLDTTGIGIPVVVYNPTDHDRSEPVEVALGGNDKSAKYDVVAPGDVVVGMIEPGERKSFVARVPALGYAVYHLVRCYSEEKQPTPAGPVLANDQFLVRFNSSGDVSSLFDRTLNKELLTAPIRMELLDDISTVYTAWEIMHDTVTKAPRGYVDGTPTIRSGNGWVVVTRKKDGSTFVQRYSLPAGTGTLRVENKVDWRTKGTLLKVAFPLSSANASATYDLGLGTIARGNNTEKLYEVPAQQWADLTKPDGSYGVSILSESKYGWDKPSDGTLRLTLIHTGNSKGRWTFQDANDLGQHSFTYAIRPHKGDWREGTVRAAEDLNHPLIAYVTTAHAGPLGNSFSLVRADQPSISVKAVKKAEDGNGVVVRVFETEGKPHQACSLRFASRVLSVESVDGQENEVGIPVSFKANTVQFPIKAYQPRAFRIKLAPLGPSRPVVSTPLSLPFDLDVVSGRGEETDGDFDGEGHSLVAELLPKTLAIDGVSFAFGGTKHGEKNAISLNGQRISVPAGTREVVLLGASAKGGSPAWPNYSARIGQWDNRVVNGKHLTDPALFEKPYYTRKPIAWVGTHRHNPKGDDLYQFTYLFKTVLSVKPGATELVLPSEPNVRILAASAVLSQRPDVNNLTLVGMP